MSDTFACLGAAYPYAVLAPIVCEKFLLALANQERGETGRPMDRQQISLAVVKCCADEAANCRRLSGPQLRMAAERYPESKPNLWYGFEYLINVYPLPCWKAAIDRAAQRLGM